MHIVKFALIILSINNILCKKHKSVLKKIKVFNKIKNLYLNTKKINFRNRLFLLENHTIKIELHNL